MESLLKTPKLDVYHGRVRKSPPASEVKLNEGFYICAVCGERTKETHFHNEVAVPCDDERSQSKTEFSKQLEARRVQQIANLAVLKAQNTVARTLANVKKIKVDLGMRKDILEVERELEKRFEELLKF